MKQKIVIEANIWCDKCRSKAMKVAAVEYGVNSVAFKGPRRDQVEIIGDEVDAVRLAKLLRKKLGYADLVSVAEFTEGQPEKPPCSNDVAGCHYHEMELHIYDPPSSGGCTIM